MDGDEVLQGGIANAGAVIRSGTHVLRPGNPHSTSIHRLLRYVRDAGFCGASVPVGIDPDGTERLDFIVGDVALPPYPAWVQSTDALTSVVRLLRGLHDASESFDGSADAWSRELADPQAASLAGAGRESVMCHNDVCLENVVFSDGRAIALLDFDFAAPGRRTFDIAAFARMCVPVDDDTNSARLGWASIDKPARLRAVCDAYGLDADGRMEMMEILTATIELGGEFVRRRVEAGEVAFIEMWNKMGGQGRFDRRRRWWQDRRPDFDAAMN